MKHVGLIFPHQLFKQHPVLAHTNEVYLIEDSLFFGDPYTKITMHTNKLILHRASMKAYADTLTKQGVVVHYIKYTQGTTIRDASFLQTNDTFYVVDPTDFLLSKRLQESISSLVILDSPLFINTKDENQQYLASTPSYAMHTFYQYQRKRLGILLDASSGPLGGSWSYDAMNRKAIPKHHLPSLPNEPQEYDNAYVQEAKNYVADVFERDVTTIQFIYPCTHADAEHYVSQFLSERFANFGTYEDAMVEGKSLLYHSLLSPLLNIGLLHPLEVVQQAIHYAERHDIALHNTEGFIRQIIGWREYIRMLYEEQGVAMRTSNQWKHVRPLPHGYWDSTTGIPPLDDSIRRIQKTGYTHHIERLMLHGNFLFLNEVDPNDVYAWFMTQFIDSYDWVMVPNVYGMTQFTIPNLMTTKPYISGSNYVKKMSTYPSGSWSVIWDALFWSYIIDHLDILKKQGRMHFVVAKAASFTETQKQTYHAIRNAYQEKQG